MIRHVKTPAFKRFLKYALVGGSTFAFDLLLIWIMTEFFAVPYWLSTALGFLIAVSLNYLLSRRFVFKGTSRRMHHGYLYFILFAIGGAFLISGAVAFMVTYLSLHYLTARALVACVVGMGNYLFNLHVNFKVAGHHP
ncbi:MAG: GtrA family protein [Patescibacteria group bacterium]